MFDFYLTFVKLIGLNFKPCLVFYDKILHWILDVLKVKKHFNIEFICHLLFDWFSILDIFFPNLSVTVLFNGLFYSTSFYILYLFLEENQQYQVLECNNFYHKLLENKKL